MISSDTFTIPLHVQTVRPNSKRDRDEASGPTLREFIGADENRLVPIAVDAVLQSVTRYNPLVFYGPSGTGKSFLARGLVERWNEYNASRSAIITNGADFARDFANAIDTDSVDDFREPLRSASLLLIDDLDQMSAKIPAQIELLNTLDALIQDDCQILITLKQAPLDIQGFESGLASRLSAGLLVPLVSPGSEARRLILKHLLELYDLKLDVAAMEWIVTTSVLDREPAMTNFADLHQSVLRLVAAEENEQLLDESCVRRVLADQQRHEPLPLKSISQRVARYFGLKVSDLKGPARQQRIVRARGVAMLLARQLTDNSLEEIGRHFGKRDHTTVLHACRKTLSLIASDPAIRQAMEDMNKQLTAT